MFNSLKYAKKLEEVGVSREQAEVHMQIMTEIVETNLATKQDLKDLSLSLRQDLKDHGVMAQQQIQELRRDLKELEHRMTIKLGTIATIGIGVTATIAKFIG